MKVSLVVGTLGTRSELLARFLDSVAAGSHRDVEVIIVDQSRGNTVAPLLAQYPGLSILHLNSAPGLSRARNLGLTRMTGDVVAFPDDDCWYPDTLLASVVARLSDDPSLGGIVGHPVDDHGRSSFPRWDRRSGPVDRINVWRRSNSNALFLRRTVVERVGGFDEDLGVGAGTRWGSAEDIDYPLRVLAAGFKLYYDSALLVHHPRTSPSYDAASIARARSYGGGMGRVLRKHRYPWWFVVYSAVRPLGGVLISLGTGRLAKARYHSAVFQGRCLGWFG